MPNGEMNLQLRLQDLIVNPREDLDIEVKGWIDLTDPIQRANLGKAILALANHGGGFVVIGFTNNEGTYVEDGGRPENLDDFHYDTDTVNQIVLRYAEPPFQCHLHIVLHPETGSRFPVIVVPGQRVPVRASRSGPNEQHVRADTYYVRRPGPQSDPPRSGADWDALLRRCIQMQRDDWIDSLRIIVRDACAVPARQAAPDEERVFVEWIEGSDVRLQERLGQLDPSPFEHGYWTFSYGFRAGLEIDGLNALLDILSRVQGHETGWPPWWVPGREEIRPRPLAQEGVIECWLGEAGTIGGPGHSDFWRASLRGFLFLARGYQEDEMPPAPGEQLEVSLPIWRIGECLLHVERFASATVGESVPVIVRIDWTGLRNRRLFQHDLRDPIVIPTTAIAQSDHISSEQIVQSGTISAALPELVRGLTLPLYENFDFFAPSMAYVERHLNVMRSGHY